MKRCTRLLFAACLLLFSFSALSDKDYPAEIQPIVEGRCMVCHGCYDAPCQLKMDAWAGLHRGASQEIVYDGTRLVAAQPTRLFEDAQTSAQWREMGFYPVLNDTEPGSGVVAGMLELKQRHPLPTHGTLPTSITLGLDRDQQCTKLETFDDYQRDHPLWGMPYGLPALSDAEHRKMIGWLAQGAPGVPEAAPDEGLTGAVQRWEAFLNGDSLKERLMARYIYEHLFIANLYFADQADSNRYFNLVRSRTPPGKAVDIISTRRPYDDPGVARVYYRLRPLPTAILSKRHMPYALSDERLARWNTLFLAPDYAVKALPPYEVDKGINPFFTFRALPEEARYRFMLEEAHFTIMGFIKGPVCRGQVALNVIDDHFWVVFLDPDRPTAQESANFLGEASDNLRLPDDKERGAVISIIEWRNYAKTQLEFLQDKFDHIQQWIGSDGDALNLDYVWNGDTTNDNAALTIFRHADSASVVNSSDSTIRRRRGSSR
ncbi:MAG: fatty acid cis/trans isomerase [Halioglobus sp.]|nr:fatty acid cis/trans isomerase [Halioglobus sp.]